jgi:hypothetical protein
VAGVVEAGVVAAGVVAAGEVAAGDVAAGEVEAGVVAAGEVVLEDELELLELDEPEPELDPDDGRLTAEVGTVNGGAPTVSAVEPPPPQAASVSAAATVAAAAARAVRLGIRGASLPTSGLRSPGAPCAGRSAGSR